ncbi:MAG: cation:proton antiporter [Gordonia sp. (in: high G+C Gram-positive bacteria)]|uniref:cation:proton antiporter n=1 Tax=Gordonia sp. (in: high G+C Gram-positive bacteria) TaxID=84139 RepID=UPI003BB5AD4E
MNNLDTTILVIAGALILAPLLVRALRPAIAVPVVVAELVLGIVAGPSVLGWVEPSQSLHLVSQFGVGLLFFMAGNEIDPTVLSGRRGRRAWGGWALSFAIGLGIGALVAPGLGMVILAVALSSTALGTLLPILRDSGDLQSPFGTSVSAVGAVGEFGPIIAISLLLGSHTPGVALVVLVVFGLIAAAVIWSAGRMPRGRLHRFVESTLHTSGQFGIRLVLAILLSLLVASAVLGVDTLLGAFTAGIVWRALIQDADPGTRDAVESKIEALAFGFGVPIFFIATGVGFNLRALLDQPITLLLVPAVALLLLVVRGLPASLAAPAGSDRRMRAAVGVMGATALPIIIVATEHGVDLELISSTTATVLVGAGMLSVLVFPLVANSLRRQAAPVSSRRESDPSANSAP